MNINLKVLFLHQVLSILNGNTWLVFSHLISHHFNIIHLCITQLVLLIVLVFNLIKISGILAMPGPVSNLIADEITSSSCYLSWDIPVENGGSEITCYIVEKREDGRKAWVKVRVISLT